MSLLQRENIYMECSIRMSVKAMSDLMYAAIITKSGLPAFFGVGIYQFSRSQNSYNNVQVKIYILPDKVAEFEKISGVKLKEIFPLKLN